MPGFTHAHAADYDRTRVFSRYAQTANELNTVLQPNTLYIPLCMSTHQPNSHRNAVACNIMQYNKKLAYLVAYIKTSPK